MPVKGIPRFDAVALMEIEPVKFTAEDRALIAHGAFVDTTKGTTYGRTTCRRWSRHTLEKLEELRNAMEQDMAALVFTNVDATEPALEQAGDSVGGIGEHARDADQV